MSWRKTRVKGKAGHGVIVSPRYVIATRIADALNPDKVLTEKPSAVERWADMTEEERAAMRALYEKKR